MRAKKISATLMTMAIAAMTSIPVFAGTWIPKEGRELYSYQYVNDDGTYLSDGWYWLDRDGESKGICQRL